MPDVLGIKSLLFDLPCEKTLVAGENGARCLAISREHFFTIMYECPQLAAGFLEIIQKAEFEQLESVS